MIALNIVTKNEVHNLFVNVCEKLMIEDNENIIHYRGLIRESMDNKNKTFNLLANLCYLLGKHKDILDNEFMEFLKIIGNA